MLDPAEMWRLTCDAIAEDRAMRAARENAPTFRARAKFRALGSLPTRGSREAVRVWRARVLEKPPIQRQELH